MSRTVKSVLRPRIYFYLARLSVVTTISSGRCRMIVEHECDKSYRHSGVFRSAKSGYESTYKERASGVLSLQAAADALCSVLYGMHYRSTRHCDLVDVSFYDCHNSFSSSRLRSPSLHPLFFLFMPVSFTVAHRDGRIFLFICDLNRSRARRERALSRREKTSHEILFARVLFHHVLLHFRKYRAVSIVFLRNYQFLTGTLIIIIRNYATYRTITLDTVVKCLIMNGAL